MEKEPKELSEIRSHLVEFEKLQDYPQSVGKLSQVIAHIADLDKLSQAISHVADLLESDCAQIYKDRATRLLLAYGERVLSRVKSILSSDSYDTDTLKHWYDVMDEFSTSGSFDHPEFNPYKKQLFQKWLESLFHSMNPWEQQLFMEYLQEVKTKREKSG